MCMYEFDRNDTDGHSRLVTQTRKRLVIHLQKTDWIITLLIHNADSMNLMKEPSTTRILEV